ncbi:hypothetical protein GCM10010399_87350 [Dactylosporangium fulvum]|uniref:Uncharacterized protein n=1 Tax=Dactylosporangium fulvum TaxID=53359 RepID=A0ABY5VQR8_9ACTN|nr:hypothetical protein [Dactylosporangium fulvum]UWP79154.1 hypothetical protein Dfulv_28755 [Dactylosporangium fulvum]
MGRGRYEHDHRLAGPAGAERPAPWVGSRNTPGQLVATARRRHFAYLDRYIDRLPDADPCRTIRERKVPEAAPRRVVEVGSGIALAVGIALATASGLILAAACGLGLLARL